MIVLHHKNKIHSVASEYLLVVKSCHTLIITLRKYIQQRRITEFSASLKWINRSTYIYFLVYGERFHSYSPQHVYSNWGWLTFASRDCVLKFYSLWRITYIQYKTIKNKGKSYSCLVYAPKAYKGSGGIAPLIFILCINTR
jgi:hypothetical protein